MELTRFNPQHLMESPHALPRGIPECRVRKKTWAPPNIAVTPENVSTTCRRPCLDVASTTSPLLSADHHTHGSGRMTAIS